MIENCRDNSIYASQDDDDDDDGIIFSRENNLSDPAIRMVKTPANTALHCLSIEGHGRRQGCIPVDILQKLPRNSFKSFQYT